LFFQKVLHAPTAGNARWRDCLPTELKPKLYQKVTVYYNLQRPGK